MKHSTSQTLFAYWNEVRDGRPAPRRFDIEPSRLSTILAETLILERIDFETYRFRLAGTQICRQFGHELRGTDFFTLWDDDDDRVTLEHHLSCITRQFKVGVFSFDALPVRDGPEDLGPPLSPVSFEMILLPLVHTRGRVDRCLGAISRAYSPEASTDLELTGHRLTASRLLTAHSDGTDGGRAQGDRQTPIDGTVRSARIVRSDRRQFRVYDGGRANEPAIGLSLHSDND